MKHDPTFARDSIERQSSFLPVAVGIVCNGRGEVLITRRRRDSHQGGLWEFPGGKQERGESGYGALCRELKEEVDITVASARPLIRVPHDYGGHRVLLDTWWVTRWSGTPQGRESQPMAWVAPASLGEYAFPAADIPIIRAIDLPDQYLITPEPDWEGPDGFLTILDGCLSRGIRLVQLRVKEQNANRLTPEEYRAFLGRVVAHCNARGARCLLNGEPALAREVGMHGVHLTSRRLLAERERASELSGDGFLVGASCHDRGELEHACRIGVDFAVLAPVQATKTHPGATPLTWAVFSEWVNPATIPVYALGGLSPKDRETAWENGGQGIAAIRGLWLS
uniref:8-oxo-dGTP diphosphatase n=1 Tax=Candidatus Kentrum sp. DK TaxID=2126562 RepID=A0A450RXC0_9GAMM|nr:MAG: 8-oxo-dGTPase [Candidatus Kentron sp. DK]